jgi:DinB superfamily
MEFDRVLPPLAEEDHRCEPCRYSYSDVTIEAATELVRSMPHRYGGAIAATPEDILRIRPDTHTWSVLEYLCHVRDVYMVGTIRLYRIRCEDRPALEPMLNDLRTVRFRHNEYEPDAVLRELGFAVAGCLDEVARVTDWDRVATRMPTEERTARWQIRHLAHEGLHHQHDVGRVRAAVL